MFPKEQDSSMRILNKFLWLIFLSFTLLLPDYILAKSMGGASQGKSKSVQQSTLFTAGNIVSDKVPQVIADRISAGSVEEFIVLFEAQDVKLQVSQMRLSKALTFDDQNIVNFKAVQFSAIKQKVMATLAVPDVEMIEDYSQLPMAFIRCKSVAGLKQLINNPLVKSIYENKRNQLFLTESLTLINQPQVAASGFTGAGTTVAVLDTGLDFTLPAFGSCSAPGVPTNCRVIHAQDFAPDDGMLDDNPNQHGTNVAGIVLGVAPNTQIAALDVFPVTGGASDSDIISAINWVIANKTLHNIVAMNLSLGGGQFFQECPADALSQPFFQAREVGVLPIVATGNNAFKDSIASPACAPGAVRVGAVYDANVGGPFNWSSCTDNQTSTDLVTCFSNSAPFMTLLAPGALINAAGIQIGGTSQATPHVAGAVAVLRAPNTFPTESLGQTVTRLVTTGVPVTDPLNSLVKPRLDLLAAVEAVILPTFPEIGTPSVFQQLNIANGVTTDDSGNIYVHYDNGLNNVLSKFTPGGVVQWSTAIGGPLDIGRTGRLTIFPSTGEIVDLLSTGELAFFNPATGAGFIALDFRQAIIDTSNVYEASSGTVMNMSAQILQPNIVYGDVSILHLGNQLDIFAAGLSTNSAIPFVIRFRFINNILTDAKVLVASILQTGNQNGGTVAPRGVAVNNQGVVLTSLPVLPCPTCTFGVDVGVTFDVNYEPATDPVPTNILNNLDLHSLGMGTDNMGNFYLATGATGISFCGSSGSGALVVVSESMDNVGCGEIGAVLAGSNDVALNPTDDTAYMTLSSSLTFNGVLEFPITHPPVAVDSDGDGIADNMDNCISVANAGQEDTNGDNIGNACDTDLNNDCVVNFLDSLLFRQVFPSNPVVSQLSMDSDFNSDNVVNFIDSLIFRPTFPGVPGPSALGCN